MNEKNQMRIREILAYVTYSEFRYELKDDYFLEKVRSFYEEMVVHLARSMSYEDEEVVLGQVQTERAQIDKALSVLRNPIAEPETEEKVVALSMLKLNVEQISDILRIKEEEIKRYLDSDIDLSPIFPTCIRNGMHLIKEAITLTFMRDNKGYYEAIHIADKELTNFKWD